MSSKQKRLVFSAMFALSFLSSIYLNMELQATETALAVSEANMLPDVGLIKTIFKMILQPLRLG